MLILSQEPHGDEARRAFNALDEAFGVDEFSEAEAKEALTLHGFGPTMLSALTTSGSVSEV